MEFDREVDVVFVGGGLGGLAGAVSAASVGLTSVVIEKAGFIGGGAAYSGGLCWVPGVGEDSIEAAHDYIRFAQGERSFDEDLLYGVLEAMAEALTYYRSCGIALEVVPNNPDVLYPKAPGALATGRMWESTQYGEELGAWRHRLLTTPHYRIGVRHSELFEEGLSSDAREVLFEKRQREDLLTMGPGLVGSFASVALIRFGVECITDTEVADLVIEGGRVIGVRSRGATGEIAWRAREGVVLATGGYGWSALACDLEGMPDLVEAGPPSISGDHLRLSAEAGAALARAGDPQFSMGAQILSTDRHPGTDVPLHLQMFDVMGKPHSMVVNRHGYRFGDESYYVGINQAIRDWDPIAKEWSNYPCFLIVDENFRNKYDLGSVTAGQPYPDSIARGDTLEELADALGIPGAHLHTAVDKFNENAERGVDPEFGRGSSPFIRRRYGDVRHKPNENLGPLTEAPFYGLPLRPLGFGICSVGLVTDCHGRVLRWDGSPVPGLFATGNAVATTEFRGYVTGYANTRNMAMAHASVMWMRGERS